MCVVGKVVLGCQKVGEPVGQGVTVVAHFYELNQ